MYFFYQSTNHKVLTFSEKFKINIEKSEKYSMKLFSLNSPLEILGL